MLFACCFFSSGPSTVCSVSASPFQHGCGRTGALGSSQPQSDPFKETPPPGHCGANLKCVLGGNLAQRHLCRLCGCNSTSPGCAVSDFAGSSQSAWRVGLWVHPGFSLSPTTYGRSPWTQSGSAVEGTGPARFWGPGIAWATRNFPADSGSSCSVVGSPALGWRGGTAQGGQGASPIRLCSEVSFFLPHSYPPAPTPSISVAFPALAPQWLSYLL